MGKRPGARRKSGTGPNHWKVGTVEGRLSISILFKADQKGTTQPFGADAGCRADGPDRQLLVDVLHFRRHDCGKIRHVVHAW